MDLFKKINRQKSNSKFRKKTFADEDENIPMEGAYSVLNQIDASISKPVSSEPVFKESETVGIASNERESVRPKKSHKSSGVNLSFGDDDEQEPIFKIKKSSASRKLAKLKLKELEVEPQETDSKTVQESYVSYDDDTLSILRKQQDSVNSRIGKGIYESQENSEIWINTTGNATTAIPDANHIYLAKKKREKIRQGVFDPDEEDPFHSKEFVSLKPEGDNNLEFGSRLLREEDEIGDGEEELNFHMGERMTLKKGNMKDQFKKQAQDEMQKALDEFERIGDSDEEFATLERNRLRQAMGGSKFPSTLENNLSMPKVSQLPSFPTIRMTIQNEINLYKERILPYQASIQSKSAIVASLDIQLKEMSLQCEALETRILKYGNLQKQISQ